MLPREMRLEEDGVEVNERMGLGYKGQFSEAQNEMVRSQLEDAMDSHGLAAMEDVTLVDDTIEEVEGKISFFSLDTYWR